MKKKVRVLQFPIANSKGGITQYALRNWKFINRDKFQFDFATMSKTLDFAEELEQSGCKVYYISCYAEENEKKFVDEFRKILLVGHYDVIHLHTKQWKSFNVEKIASEVGVPKIIVHAHSSGIDTLDDERRKAETELHYSMRKMLTDEIATDFWACSRLAADFLYGTRISRDKVVVMNNAIELSVYAYDKRIREQYRRELKLEDKLVIGNVGRLVYQKNQEFLLSVFKEICEMRKDCVLLLVGEGEKETEYRQYVEENNLAEQVVFLGHRKDVSCLLQAMDLFCLPSRFEGLPLVLIEAQAAGVKCLYSNTITKEVELTENIKQLALNVDVWKKEILAYKDLEERKDMREHITAKGYNVEEQIKKIEREYSK